MIIANPFTGQVLNVNPEGCNQYTGKDCDGDPQTLEEFKQENVNKRKLDL